MSIGGSAGLTYNDLVEKTYRRLMANQREVVAKLVPGYTVGDGILNLSSPGVNSIGPGALLAVDWTVYRVDQWIPAGQIGGVAQVTVVQGSQDANHAENADVYVNPKYTRFDCAVAIQDSLRGLSSPTNGVYNEGFTTITYNPVYMGYDLGAIGIPSTFNSILEVSYDISTPTHNMPRMLKWDLRRGITNAKFPSGYGIIFYEGAWPGLNINVAYGYPFTLPTFQTDDITTVCGLADSAIDIPPLMAEVFLTESREIKRNFIESQPDPRKAQDVPPGAMLGSTNKLELRIAQRISEEADRQAIRWPHRRTRD